MKVLLINGSSRKECTYTALSKVAESLKEEGIETVLDAKCVLKMEMLDVYLMMIS